jgi:hypothetical protein
MFFYSSSLVNFLSIPRIFETANAFWKVAAGKNIAMPEIPAAPEFS